MHVSMSIFTIQCGFFIWSRILKAKFAMNYLSKISIVLRISIWEYLKGLGPHLKTFFVQCELHRYIC